MHPKLLLKREITNNVYCSRYLSSSQTPFHFHSIIELYVVINGQVDVWIDRSYKRLGKGEIALSLSYDPHRYVPIDTAEVFCLIVPQSMCPEFSGKSIKNPFIINEELYKNVIECLSVISKNKNAMLTNGCISVVFGLLLESVDFTERESTVEYNCISKALLYLHENYKADISLNSVAMRLGVNMSYLSRQFKSALGINFNQYLTLIRLREAILLLKKGESVSFCAFESGFNSERTFYRAFSKEFGCTPGGYLKKS